MNNNLEEIRLLVFDFDGTLIDNTYHSFNKFKIILKKLNLPTISENVLRENWGKPLADLVKIVAKEVEANTNQEEWLAKSLDQDNDLEICKGYQNSQIERKIQVTPNFDRQIINTLDRLHSFGYLIGLLTSRKMDSLKNAASPINLDLNIFDYIQAKEDSEYHKPDGRVFIPLRRWARRKSLKTENIVYFGDTIIDFKATQTSEPKIKFIGVASGITKPSQFLANKISNITDYQGLCFFIETMFLFPHNQN